MAAKVDLARESGPQTNGNQAEIKSPQRSKSMYLASHMIRYSIHRHMRIHMYAYISSRCIVQCEVFSIWSTKFSETKPIDGFAVIVNSVVCDMVRDGNV